jgi:hypothetical protein
MRVEEPRLDLLELLATELEVQTKIPFNYSYWVGMEWAGDPEISCGTTACAAGLATTMQVFRDLGLRLGRNRWDVGMPVFGGLVGEEAMAGVLDISIDEARYLFLPDIYLPNENENENENETCEDLSPEGSATAKEVAAHIRAFVAWKRAQKEKQDGRSAT